jgi:CRISPR-associated protein Cmr5
MKAVNRLLGAAQAAIIRNGILKTNDTIDDVYKGYVSSFGASVIMSGLAPALAFYEDDEKRKKILNAIAQISTGIENIKGKQLFDDYKSGKTRQELRAATEKIINASIALKIVMRTYRFVNTQNHN